MLLLLLRLLLLLLKLLLMLKLKLLPPPPPPQQQLLLLPTAPALEAVAPSVRLGPLSNHRMKADPASRAVRSRAGRYIDLGLR